MIMPRVLVLADDLTGALEAAACFAVSGLPAVVTTDVRPGPPGLDGSEPVLVVDTETRHLPGAEARRIVRRLVSAARELGIASLFKKTDSTLRGNIAAELNGVAEGWPGSPIVYAPAYPRLGRTVRSGVLLVEGRPVSETAFAGDPLNPVCESHIPTLLRSAGLTLPILSLRPDRLCGADTAAVYVVDGETEEEVESCATEFARCRLPLAAGPAGFARHLAAVVDLPRGEPPSRPRVRSCLVVSGSLHPASQAQIRRALDDGVPEIEPAEAPRLLREPAWAVLKPPVIEARDGLEFARKLGVIVARVLKDAQPDAMVVFGGDSAYGILSALGGPPLRSLGEAATGVPLASIAAGALSTILPGRNRDLVLATKAGGFGSDDVVARIRASLTEV